VKLKVLVSLVSFLVVSLLGSPESISGSSEQTHYRNTNGLVVPSYLTDVPPEHFAGISTPSNSLAEARKSAISDAIRQILGAIGVKYSHHYFDAVSGNVRNPQRVIDDKLSGNAQGIVLDIERNIVKRSWLTDTFSKYVYFVLVYYPEEKIQEMRRLSKGAKVVANVLHENSQYAELKVSEVNGVSVVISSAEIMVTKKNRFAKIITLFFWRVPSGSEYEISIPITPLKLCRNSIQIRLSMDNSRRNFGDYFLGAERKKVAVLSGHDEIGRPVRTKVYF
jgi:hypothetical protein